MAWHARDAECSIEDRHAPGAPGWRLFMRQSGVVTSIVHQKLRDHLPVSVLTPGGGRVLEFGAGRGRITLNLRARTGQPSDACDIDGAAMSWLCAQAPGLSCAIIDAEPPLPYADAIFDAVIAIAVWRTLTADAGLRWLQETARVLKPGGAALISLCGPDYLAFAPKVDASLWDLPTPTDIKGEGTAAVRAGAFTFTAYSHDHITGVFGGILPVEAIYPGLLEQREDLVVLRKGR